MKLLSLLLVLSASSVFAEGLTVSSDFPGGSGEVTTIDRENRLIVINPADHPGKGWRCWWYVRIENPLPGESFLLDVGEAPWATPDRCSLSTDDGATWHAGPEGTRDGKRIRYRIQADQRTVRVAWGPPFLPSDARRLVEAIASGTTSANAFELCRTREGHATPALRIGPEAKDTTEGRPLVWVQARQHAWESGSSWVAKGFTEWLVSDAPRARRIRDNCEVVIVPVMDIDNVRRGAGGKNQVPQDHNRDWSEDPHWHAVRAAQRELSSAAEEGRLAVFIDLHNPGATNRFTYFYVPPRDTLVPEARTRLDSFLQAAAHELRGPLRFTGKTIESGSQYDPKAWRRMSKNWVAALGTPAVAVTLEVPWNTRASTTQGYETTGSQLGRTIERYLRDLEG